MRASVRRRILKTRGRPAGRPRHCIVSRHVSGYSNRSILPIAKAVKQTIELLQLSVSNKQARSHSTNEAAKRLSRFQAKPSEATNAASNQKGQTAYELIFFIDISLLGVGRSRRYCNTGPTRGEVGASSCIFSQFQKSV